VWLVSVVADWDRIESGLDPSWSEAQLVLTVRNEAGAARAAALLAPATPMHAGKTIWLAARRSGGPFGPEAVAVRRLLRRVDEERIPARLALVSAVSSPPDRAEEEAAADGRPGLARAWDEELAELPADWSDLHCELGLLSTDHLEPAALQTAPLNPTRFGDAPAYRFRCARRFGYGASPAMVRRCLERLDAEGIRGEVHVLRVLCDTDPVQTQGPVWYVGGRAV
jgi:hypothetical protein